MCSAVSGLRTETYPQAANHFEIEREFLRSLSHCTTGSEGKRCPMSTVVTTWGLPMSSMMSCNSFASGGRLASATFANAAVFRGVAFGLNLEMSRVARYAATFAKPPLLYHPHNPS